MTREWFKISELIGLPGLPGTNFGVQKWLIRHKVPHRPRTMGKGIEYHLGGLPVSAVAALVGPVPSQSIQVTVPASPPSTDAPCTLSEPCTLKDDVQGASVAGAKAATLETLSDTTRAEAGRRAAACLAVRRLIDAGATMAAAVAEVAITHKCSPVTLRKWWIRVRNISASDYAVQLAPRRGGTRRASADFTHEAWEFLKADYLRPEKPMMATCYWRLSRVAKDNNWVIPSYRTCVRRMDSLPWEMVSLARDGEDGLLRKLPVMTRTRGHLTALQAVNADGHVFDVRVKMPSGVIGRPMLTAWQDLYSGKVLAWRLSETLNQHIVRLSFGDMVEKYGVPKHAYLDNGREFANKWLTGGSNFRFRFTIREEDPVGIFAQLGVEVHWTTPYHGQSKPIERAFCDLCNEISRHPAAHGAYTGNSTTNKPANYGSKAMEWNDFVSLVTSEIAAHNARAGRRTETAKGRSFDETFAESYSRATIARASADQRRLWLLAAEGVTVRNTGHVGILGNVYWGEALPPIAGQRVVVRFDPEHLEMPVAVYAATGELLCEAARTMAAFDDAEAAKEHARANRRRVKAAKEMLAAENQMSAIEAAQMIPAALEDPDGELSPGVVRVLPPKRKTAVGAEDLEKPLSEETQRQETAVLTCLPDWMANRFALGGL